MGEVAGGLPGPQVCQPHGRWCHSTHAQQEAFDGVGEVAVHSCRVGSSAILATGCCEPHPQAQDVDGMGEVAAGLPGPQVCQPHGRWCNSAHAQQEAFNGTTAAEMAYQQQLIRRGLMRMIRAKLAAAMNTWREQAAEAKRAAHMAGGAIRRMLQRQLSMAWEKWQYEAAEMKRQQIMLQGAVNRMLKRQMSMAWEKWQAVYQDQKFAARMGGGAIRRMLNRKLSMAWEKWQFTLGCRVGSSAILATGCCEPHPQAQDVDGMGEVAGGLPGPQVCQPHGRWCNSAHAQQEAFDGLGAMAAGRC
eukprot:TRINITY_DN520_c0_g1_i24.p1 TRINITY_DN520_c0_g1~~TRINITY_DN520_c0_g1_i24.p1  ORF type:complete len:303 (-),score=44.24 TRINITY_DN520_c0_g1_i24:29-937(-)